MTPLRDLVARRFTQAGLLRHSLRAVYLLFSGYYFLQKTQERNLQKHGVELIQRTLKICIEWKVTTRNYILNNARTVTYNSDNQKFVFTPTGPVKKGFADPRNRCLELRFDGRLRRLLAAPASVRGATRGPH